MKTITKFIAGNPATATRFNVPLLDSDDNFNELGLSLQSVLESLSGALADISAMQETINGLLAGTASLPVGAIIPYVGSGSLTGYLPCDYSLYNKSDHIELWQVLSGFPGHDVSTFRTPDLRGRVIIGSGQGTGLTLRGIADSGGQELTQISIAQMPEHDHASAYYYVANAQGGSGAGWGAAPNTYKTGKTGGGQGHDNMQPFLCTAYWIKC